MPQTLSEHCEMVARAILSGRVIPFFGAGVNLYGRPEGVDWTKGCNFLPRASELAEHLAETIIYPWADKQNLLRVSEYIALTLGSGSLYDELREIFDRDYPLTPLHLFFAGLPALMRERGSSGDHQLIVTTNYDDVMERAFVQAGEPFDQVAYVADDGQQRGKFWHSLHGGGTRLIKRPNKYRSLSLDKRSVILKLHGTVDRKSSEQDGQNSFVITEDHYIDYLTRADASELSKFVPVTLAAKLRRSHLLFLGYSLSDWNLRVILQRIWGNQELSWNSWAIMSESKPFDDLFWQKHNVEIRNVPLEDYINELGKHIGALADKDGR